MARCIGDDTQAGMERALEETLSLMLCFLYAPILEASWGAKMDWNERQRIEDIERARMRARENYEFDERQRLDRNARFDDFLNERAETLWAEHGKGAFWVVLKGWLIAGSIAGMIAAYSPGAEEQTFLQWWLAAVGSWMGGALFGGFIGVWRGLKFLRL
jgi:hypothetical protein